MRNRFSIESLESRRLLVAFAVNGTPLNDTIRVSVSLVSITVELNGVVTSAPLAGFDGVVVNAGDGSDEVEINANSVRVTVAGGGGNDSFKVAFSGGNLDAIGAGMELAGGIGDDSLATYDDFNVGTGRTYVLSQFNSLDWGTGAQLLNDGIETIDIVGSQANDALYATSGPASAQFNLNGSGGADRLLLSLETTALNIPRPVTTLATEEIYFNDGANTFNDIYSLTSTGLTRTAWAGLQFVTGPQSIDMKTGVGPELIEVLSLPSTLTFPPIIDTGPGADRIYVEPLNVPLRIDAAAGDDSIYANSLNAPGSLTLLVEAGGFNELVIGANATLRLFGTDSTWSRAFSLDVASTGRLNLTRTSLILDVPSLGDPLYAKVDAWLASGRAGGNWNGYGIGGDFITLSGRPAGIGAGPATLFSPSLPVTLGGFSADLSSIILRHTIEGDTNLDRAVNFDDLLSLAQHYGTNTLPFWFRGDFDYDGDTDFDNLLALAQNYQQPYALSAANAPVPSRDSLRVGVAVKGSKSGIESIGRAASTLLASEQRMMWQSEWNV